MPHSIGQSSSHPNLLLPCPVAGGAWDRVRMLMREGWSSVTWHARAARVRWQLGWAAMSARLRGAKRPAVATKKFPGAFVQLMFALGRCVTSLAVRSTEILRCLQM